MVNTVILITKQYVYACKCKGEKLWFNNVLSIINNYIDLEEIVARRKNIIYKKWKINDNAI